MNKWYVTTKMWKIDTLSLYQWQGKNHSRWWGFFCVSISNIWRLTSNNIRHVPVWLCCNAECISVWWEKCSSKSPSQAFVLQPDTISCSKIPWAAQTSFKAPFSLCIWSSTVIQPDAINNISFYASSYLQDLSSAQLCICYKVTSLLSCLRDPFLAEAIPPHFLQIVVSYLIFYLPELN